MTNYPKGPLLHHQQLCCCFLFFRDLIFLYNFLFTGQLSTNPSTSNKQDFLKVRYEKCQPLKSICHCIKTWKLSIKIGKVYDDALMK